MAATSHACVCSSNRSRIDDLSCTDLDFGHYQCRVGTLLGAMAHHCYRAAGTGHSRVGNLATQPQYIDYRRHARCARCRLWTGKEVLAVMSADVSARLAWPDDAPAIAKIQRSVWRAD